MAYLIPLAVGGLFFYSFFNSASNAKPQLPVAATAPPAGFMSFTRTTNPEALDREAIPERIGAHHVAHQFGTGKIHFTHEVMDHISSL